MYFNTVHVNYDVDGIHLSPAIYWLIRAAVEEHQVTDAATPAPGRQVVREQARRTRRDNSVK